LRNAILNFAHQITKPEPTKSEPKPEPANKPEATGASERAMLIIGGMQELGEETPKHHQEAAKFIADNIGLFANKPKIILLGSLCEYMFEALPNAKYFPSADAILRYFNSNQEAFHNINAIFVKGSHSTGAYKIAKFLLQYRAKQQD
jgi:UDP-N-acetylmuramyl pentapeptide synthase